MISKDHRELRVCDPHECLLLHFVGTRQDAMRWKASGDELLSLVPRADVCDESEADRHRIAVRAVNELGVGLCQTDGDCAT